MSLLALLLAIPSLAHGAEPSQVQGGGPSNYQWTVASRSGSRYEQLYGQPMFFSLELLVGPSNQNADAPAGRAIRTSGFLYVVPTGGSHPQCSLCTELHDCLSLGNPVPEIADAFFSGAPFRNGETADVVGVFGSQLADSKPAASPAAGRGGFLFWSFDSGPTAERGAASGEVTLERLVRSPRQFEGRSIVVRGDFRGANLFADMPQESRLDASDWVLRDGPFFIWVTGRAPRGQGFSLDLASRGTTTYRLEVEGRPKIQGGLVYLKASDVRLLGSLRGAEP